MCIASASLLALVVMMLYYIILYLQHFFVVVEILSIFANIDRFSICPQEGNFLNFSLFSGCIFIDRIVKTKYHFLTISKISQIEKIQMKHNPLSIFYQHVFRSELTQLVLVSWVGPCNNLLGFHVWSGLAVLTLLCTS